MPVQHEDASPAQRIRGRNPSLDARAEPDAGPPVHLPPNTWLHRVLLPTWSVRLLAGLVLAIGVVTPVIAGVGGWLLTITNSRGNLAPKFEHEKAREIGPRKARESGHERARDHDERPRPGHADGVTRAAAA